MAAIVPTQISANSADLPIPFGPFHVEFWRAAYGTVGDTITIAPKRGRFVVSAIGGPPASNVLSSLGTNTNVVLTLTASGATDVTSDIMILVME